MKTRILFISLFLLSTLFGSAQISDSQYQKIDSLFVDWNKPNHPGGTVGIVENGKTVFSKAYGLASLDYLVPNSPSTIFNIASVSKQFTAMGIVILQQEGKLGFDDDIRKYLPELPDFGETITIRHMLHHTSGLRSLHAMLGLAGWRSDDARTNEDLNRFMMNQRDLNFKPGDEYMYCNTGYMLMVNIIEKITGEKFPKWMRESVFEPLGMINTYVEDNYSSVVSNNATSYYSRGDNKFDRAVGDFNGIKSIGHGGAIGGFRSHVITCPEEKLSIVILTNFSNGSPAQKVNMIAGIIIESEKEEESIALEPIKTLKLSRKFCQNTKVHIGITHQIIRVKFI